MLSLQVLLLILQLAFIVKVICDDIDCDYILKQSDFDEGTYRIIVSGKYCLSQDIAFDPNPISDSLDRPNLPYQASFPNNASMYPGCQSLSDGPFALGFFAVITIETDNVEINLNNYSISMSESFYIQLRSTPYVSIIIIVIF